MTTSNGSSASPWWKFADGAIVRVRGTQEEQTALYGRMIAGPFARGVVVRRARPSHGYSRYLVHFAAHSYFSPVRQRKSMIPALDIVIREEHLELVTEPVTAIEAEVGR